MVGELQIDYKKFRKWQNARRSLELALFSAQFKGEGAQAPTAAADGNGGAENNRENGGDDCDNTNRAQDTCLKRLNVYCNKDSADGQLYRHVLS